MARRRKPLDPNDPSSTPLPASSRPPSQHTSLSKYALYLSLLIVFLLFLYAKLKPKLNSSVDRKEKQINSIYELTIPNEIEFSVHVLIVPSSSSSGFHGDEIFKKQSQRILNDYQNLLDETKKKQQLYFLISSRFPTNEVSNFVSSSPSLLDGGIIPTDQIFDESIATSQQNLLSSMITLLKFLDALRVRMQKTSSRRRWSDHPAIHLTFYSPESHTAEIFEHLWHTLFSINPSLDSFVESQIEVISESPPPDLPAEGSDERLLSQQLKEIDEIFRWNKIRNMNDLERYLALGGKRKISYL
jgi:hypothetical protein